jgi:hypothetical protein
MFNFGIFSAVLLRYIGDRGVWKFVQTTCLVVDLAYAWSVIEVLGAQGRLEIGGGARRIGPARGSRGLRWCGVGARNEAVRGWVRMVECADGYVVLGGALMVRSIS